MKVRVFRRLAVSLGLVAVVASSLGAGPAGANARFSPRNSAKVLNPKQHIHIMPTRSVAKKLAAAPSPFAPLATLSYHTGPVMASGTRSIPIFWEPSKLQDGTSAAVDPNYNSLISRFLKDYGGNGLYGILTQYYQDPGPQYIVNSSGMTVAIVDTTPYPTAGVLGCGENQLVNCITDYQLATEIAKVVTAGNLPRDYSTFYPVFTAPMENNCIDVNTCFWPNSLSNPSWVYCAYHGSFLLGGQPVVYANMPYADSNANSDIGCGGTYDPNLNIPVDDETGVLSHEFDESITDPDGGGGWWDNVTGNEIGDVCNGTDALVNWTAADHQYNVQTEYSAASDACLGGGPFGDNRLTLSAVSGAAGTPITISGTGFNDSVDTLLSWKFIDANGTVTTVAFPPTTDITGSFPSVSYTNDTFAIPGGAASGIGTIEVVGSTPDDAASANFTVGTVTRKPDSLIGKVGIGPWTGNNHYNTTGAGQALTMNVKRGKSYTFFAQIQNDGNVSDTFSIKGTKASAGFTIKYMVGNTNVTATVQSGAYHPVLAAGSAFIMQITITVKSTTAVNKKFKDVTLATSLAGATKDAVVETVTAK